MVKPGVIFNRAGLLLHWISLGGFARLAVISILATAILGTAGSQPLLAQFNPWQVYPSIVRVLAFDKKDSWRHNTGVVLNNAGKVLISSAFLGGATRLMVLDGGVDHKKHGRKATIVRKLPRYGIVIISVRGLSRPGVQIQLNDPRPGQQLVTVAFSNLDADINKDRLAIATQGTVNNTFRGSLGSSTKAVRLIRHNAGLKNGDNLGALFNGCNQLTGFNIDDGMAIGGNSVLALSGAELGAVIKKIRRPRVSVNLVPNPNCFIPAQAVKAPPPKLKSPPPATLPAKPPTRIAAVKKTAPTVPGPAPARPPAAPPGSSGPPPAAMPAPVAPSAARPAVPFAVGVVVSEKPDPWSLGFFLAILTDMKMGLVAGAIIVLLLLLIFLFVRRKKPEAGKKPRLTADQVLRKVRGEPEPEPQPDKASGAALAGTGWTLSGFGSKGNAIHLMFNETMLKEAQNGLTVGRSARGSQLVVNDASVSRVHARLILTDDGLTVEDLKSSNGTKVNGVRIKPMSPTQLPNGANLEIGRAVLNVSRSG